MRCGLCAQDCPAGAITIDNDIPQIDQEKCSGCGTCIEICPQVAIHDIDEAEGQELISRISSLKQKTDEIIDRIDRLKQE